jgi:hypothetical protein
MCLGSLTGFASINVLSDVGLDSRPPIVPGDEFLGFVSSQMSCRDAIMMFSDDVFSKSLVSWNVDPMFPCDHSFLVLLPVLLLVLQHSFYNSIFCVL